MYLAVLLTVMIVMGALGYWLGQRKNRAIEGLLLGALLGLIGLVILALLRPKQVGGTRVRSSQVYGAPADQVYGPPGSDGQRVSYGQPAPVGQPTQTQSTQTQPTQPPAPPY